MIKEYDVKNPTLRKTLFNKFAVRLQADDDITKNRFVEVDASTGDVELGALNSVRVVGANQDTDREADDFFYAEVGPVTVEASSPLVAGQKVKCGTDGKAVAFVDSLMINAELATGDGGGFTNQPATDGVTAVSTSADDSTQTLTVYGIDATGAVVSEELALTGDVDVDSTIENWATIVAVELDAVCVGDVELSETSAGAEIVTISAGDTQAGIVEVTDGYAYDTKVTVVADDASTAEVVVMHEATDGADATGVVAELDGTTEVALSVASHLVTRLYIGAVADTVNVDLDVTGTADSESICVGKCLVGASAGSDAVVNLV